MLDAGCWMLYSVLCTMYDVLDWNLSVPSNLRYLGTFGDEPRQNDVEGATESAGKTKNVAVQPEY